MFILGMAVGWFLGLVTIVFYIYDALEKNNLVKIGNKKLFIVKE